MAEAQLFGKYLIMRKLAAGGMGEVFLAKQQGPEGFEKFLVIKRILSHHTDNHDYVDMFFAEARLAAKMSHSNIVQIFEMGEIDGSYFIAMEYVNGKSMKDIIDAARAKSVKLELGHIADMLIKLASGLGYAHNLTDMGGNTLNIIHRDINPHNALVTYGGETKVIDFGIAKSDSEAHRTETGTIKGKFVYMSPEQSAAEKIDKRSDIFSVGIVLYEMLSGENPFQKANIVLSLDAIQRMNPPPPSTIDPSFAPFDPIVAKALAKKADDRYQDCSEFVADLQRLILSNEIPRPTKTTQQLMKELFSEQIDKEQRFIQDFLKGGTGVTVAAQRPRPASGAFRGDFNTNTSPEASAPPVQLTPAPMKTGSISYAQTNVRTGATTARRKKKRTTFYALMGVITMTAVATVVIILTAQPKAPPAPQQPNIIGLNTETAPIGLPVPSQPTAPDAAVKPPPEPKPAEPAKEAAAPKPAAEEKKPKHEDKPFKGEKKLAKEAKARAEEPSEGAAPAKPTRQERAEAAAQVSGGGIFMIYPTPAAPVFRDGTRLGSGGGPTKVEVNKASGTIKIGDGATPFQITFSYRVNGKSVDLAVDSTPWAILKRDGISLGKTPRPGINTGSTTQRFEFVSPGVQGGMTVVLRFTPG